MFGGGGRDLQFYEKYLHFQSEQLAELFQEGSNSCFVGGSNIQNKKTKFYINS